MQEPTEQGQPNNQCTECGCDPNDLGANVGIRWDGGKRLTRLLLIVLLLIAAVISMPWVQSRTGWKAAIYDFREARPSHTHYFPMFDPLVRWKDLQAAAERDPDAIDLLERGMKRQLLLMSRHSEYEDVAISVSMLSDDRRFENHRADQLPKDTDASWERRKKLYMLGASMESRSVGWPYRWYQKSDSTIFDYDEVASSPDPSGSVPEPVFTYDNKVRTAWHWDAIMATMILLLITGWGASKIAGRLGIKARSISRTRWATVLLGGALCVGLGLPSQSKPFDIGMTTMMDVFPRRGQAPQWDAESLTLTIEDDEALVEIATEMVQAYGDLAHPNAPVGLETVMPYDRSTYTMNIGYWGIALLSFHQIEFRSPSTDGPPRTVPVPASWRVNDFRASMSALSLMMAPGGQPEAVYMIELNLITALVCLGGAVLALHAIRLVVRPLYRARQRRRLRLGRCIWCTYPIA